LKKKHFKFKPIFAKNIEFHRDGNWTDFKEPNCPSCSFSSYTIRQIETILNSLGYNTNEDNILSKDERRQIHDFQRKNGLRVGRLNKATLKKLGLQF
jgi:hypothetical protein